MDEAWRALLFLEKLYPNEVSPRYHTRSTPGCTSICGGGGDSGVGIVAVVSLKQTSFYLGIFLTRPLDDVYRRS